MYNNKTIKKKELNSVETLDLSYRGGVHEWLD